MTGHAVTRGFRVSGRVQGVGFRWWTRGKANELGLEGAVRNCPDGTVEVRARGTEAAVEELERRLGQGPSGARVDEVRSVESSMRVPTDQFRIVR